MPRMIVWHCDNCDRESRSESAGWLVVKEFINNKPKFYSFCNWDCLGQYLLNKNGNLKHNVYHEINSSEDKNVHRNVSLS